MKVMMQMEIVFCRSIRKRQSNHRCVIAIVIQESLNPFAGHFKQMAVSFYSCADHRQWKSIDNILSVVVIVTRETVKLFACGGLQSPILRFRVGNRSSILISSTEDNSETVVQTASYSEPIFVAAPKVQAVDTAVIFISILLLYSH